MSELGLSPTELCRRCDPEAFAFQTTADLPDLDGVIGQPRAVEAMHFGLGIQRPGYNIFAHGPEGTGKLSLVRQFFAQRAREEAPPQDWCYVYNFEQPHCPRAVGLPAGQGHQLRQDMETFVDQLRTTLAAAFEGEDYQTRRQAIADEMQEQQSQAFERLQKEARRRGLALLRTPTGLAIAPTRDGQALSPEQVQELTDEERAALEKEGERFQATLQKVMRQAPGWQRDTQRKIAELDRQVAEFAVSGLIAELRQRYEEFARVGDFLESVHNDVVENARDLIGEPPPADPPHQPRGRPSALTSTALNRYQVNVIVDHGKTVGAPVIFEDNPAHQNLFGRVDYVAQMGALLTDFHQIKAGALHQANGGYLILDAGKVLQQPYAWEGLKRALWANQVRIESLPQSLGLMSTASLEPEPIPLRVKVALVGDALLYYMLHQLDPEFGELFKVEADFAVEMERSAENQELYARLVATLARKEALRHLDREAVARVIEHSSRLVEDTLKMSTKMRNITDLLREADYWAGQSGREVVTAADVQQALDAQVRRADRLRTRSLEAIQRDIILVDTAGSRVGQINALTVLQMGTFSFGRPSRITARVRLGRGQVVDIEREVKLGGPLHSKGVLILSGFLGARYAQDYPLALAASLVFEQSYGGVDGDSASSAELYALLSASGEVPLRQSLAVTGSVDQHGRVQAIGGVNDKIEGFFDVCQARGLTGEQGVLIPRSNVAHLMLRPDVVEAVAAGRFHIYPVETIDQGLELLTGLPAGERDDKGNYPPDSVNDRVQRRLVEMAKKVRARSPGKEEEDARPAA